MLNVALIQSTWTSLKAQLATIQANADTMRVNLRTFEDLCNTMRAQGAADVAEWAYQQARQACAGYKLYSQPTGQPGTGYGARPVQITVFADEAGAPRDLGLLGDQRPITAVPSGAANGLT